MRMYVQFGTAFFREIVPEARDVHGTRNLPSQAHPPCVAISSESVKKSNFRMSPATPHPIPLPAGEGDRAVWLSPASPSLRGCPLRANSPCLPDARRSSRTPYAPPPLPL